VIKKKKDFTICIYIKRLSSGETAFAHKTFVFKRETLSFARKPFAFPKELLQENTKCKHSLASKFCHRMLKQWNILFPSQSFNYHDPLTVSEAFSYVN